MSHSPQSPAPRPRCSTLEQGLRRAADIITNAESRAKIEKALQNNLMSSYEVTIRHRPQDGVHVEIMARTFQQNKVAYFAGLEGPGPEPRSNTEPGGNGQ